MTCEHGFIGSCAECDGSGQIPEPMEPQVVDRETLIWCFVCKRWVSARTTSETCPICGNDEIEHDE